MADPGRRVTQVIVETDEETERAQRFTQVMVEADHLQDRATRFTQVMLEVDVAPPTGVLTSGVAMPDYEGDARGVPLAGDRAAWDVVEYPERHAKDLKDGTPVHHVPVGQNAGDVLVWDGEYWEVADPEEISIANHDHSGDAGDGGTFDAANLTSGAATDGQVLTADGAGGAAWEDPTGGSLTLEEQDGTPSVADVTTIRVTNGTLTDEGDGVVTLDFGSAATDGSAIHENEAGEIHAITEKSSLADDDEFLIEDSEDDYAKKRVKKSSLGAGGGASKFTDLSDVPQDYTGQGGKVVYVRDDESGLEFL